MTLPAGRWFPGARHCVELVAGTTDWRCIECAQVFPAWPADFMDCPGPDHAAACGHPVTDRHDLHWSDRLEDEVCPDCCEECNP